MNFLSTFGGMLGRGGQNVNSMTYINKYAKSITADFSGIAFTDLSATSSYHVTSSGLNGNNDNSSFARLKYNDTGTFLKTADFNSGSFTIYLKHAARYSTLPALNFQYPNVIQLSKTMVSSGDSFSATFYSSLNPRTVIPYAISGCAPTDLGIASLNGTFTAPYQTNVYIVANSGVSGKTITFDVCGGTAVTLKVCTVVYTTSYAADVLVIRDSHLNIVVQPLAFAASSLYLFDQSDQSNRGSQSLIFSSTLFSNTTLVGTTTTSNGTPGYTNAYTSIRTTTAVTAVYTYPGIYYMSVVTNNVGNLVLAVSTAGQTGQFYTQLDLSFGAGANVTFDVSHPSIANKYILRFGTTRNGVANETIVTRTANKVTLFIPSAYTGTNIYYYSDISAVSAYEIPVITLRGQDLSAGFAFGTSSGLNAPYPLYCDYQNVGLGMAGISSDGKRISFAIKNEPRTLSNVYDFSDNNSRWIQTTKNSLGYTNYQYNAFFDTGGVTGINGTGFNSPTGDHFLNDAGTVCVVTGHNSDGTNARGAFAVYDLSANDNRWRIRGNCYLPTNPLNSTTAQWLAKGFDTDSTCNTLVAGSNAGNYVKIYTYNSATRFYTLKQDISYCIRPSDRFGSTVRMNREGTKVIAVANWNNDLSANYARIYTSVDGWNSVSSVVDLSVNNNIFGTPRRAKSHSNYLNVSTVFISKALDLYLSVDTTNNTNVYALDSSSGIATLRNTIPNCNYFGALETTNANYSYNVSLSGNGKRIIIIGGWVNNTTYGYRTRFYDYDSATNTWEQSGITFDNIGVSTSPRIQLSPVAANTFYGCAVSMTYDGHTMVVGDPHFGSESNFGRGSGAQHVLKCVTPQTFTYNTGTYYVAVQQNVLGNYVFALSTVGLTGPFANNMALTFEAGYSMTFNVSHASMAGYTFVIGSTPDGTPNTSLYTTSNGVVTVNIPVTYTGSTCYYFGQPLSGMGYNPLSNNYYLQVVTNNVGDLVFATSTAGKTGPYITQRDVSFGAGTLLTFDVSHPTIANKYRLRFGTARNGTPDETYVTRANNQVVLTIPTTYTGANIFYYSDVSAVSAYITPVITLRGQDMNSQLTFGRLTGLTYSTIPDTNLNFPAKNTNHSHAGFGMAGITSTGKTLAYALHNNFHSLGFMCDYSDITKLWVHSTTKNNKYGDTDERASVYQFNPFADTNGYRDVTNAGYGIATGFNWPNHNYYLNDTGTMCVITGHNNRIYAGAAELTSGTRQPGAFAIYEISNNIWRLRGNTSFYEGESHYSFLAATFDTDASFNTLVAGSSSQDPAGTGGNFIKIYTYNFTSLTYDNPVTISGGNLSTFGNMVRMNSTGNKIIAVACKAMGGYAKIYTSANASWSSYTTTTLSYNTYTTTTPTNLFIPYTAMITATRNISKALDVYLTVDSSNNTNVFSLDTSTGIATRRNIIPEFSFFVTKPGGYTYFACLSGDGNRIFIVGGAGGSQFKMNIYDYNLTTATWSQIGATLDTQLAGGIFPVSFPVTSVNFMSVSMTHDGSTIAIGDINIPYSTALGGYHVIKCVTPQTFY